MFCSIKKHLEGSTNEAGGSQEASARCAVSDGHMDVVCGGFAFRLTIFYEGEAALLHAVDPPAALSLIRNCVSTPVHVGIVSSCAGAYPAYATTVRLAKRWLSAHFLMPAVCDQMVELMVASVFSEPQPALGAPATADAGFVRFLYLVGSHDWASFPLVVDLDHTITLVQQQQIQVRLFAPLGANTTAVVAPPHPASQLTMLLSSSPFTKRARLSVCI
jgi:U3 small nucleolar RNA-associated protein 22